MQSVKSVYKKELSYSLMHTWLNTQYNKLGAEAGTISPQREPPPLKAGEAGLAYLIPYVTLTVAVMVICPGSIGTLAWTGEPPPPPRPNSA